MNSFHVFNFLSSIIVASEFVASLFLIFIFIDSLLYILQHLRSADNLSQAMNTIKLFLAFLLYQQFAIATES